MGMYGGARARRNTPLGSPEWLGTRHGGRPMEWATMLDPLEAVTTTRLPDSPVLRLIRAVLLQAISDLTRRSITHGDPRWRETVNTDAATTARRWFASDDSDTPFSFVWCCDALGLAPSRVRRACVQNTYRLVRSQLSGREKRLIPQAVPHSVSTEIPPLWTAPPELPLRILSSDTTARPGREVGSDA